MQLAALTALMSIRDAASFAVNFFMMHMTSYD
jgi:hypothetical protein